MKFTRKHPKPSIVIDMHVNLDNPYIIDGWRVMQYLESINVLYTKEQVDNELLILSLQGYLSKISEIPTRFLYNDKKI
nr:hypothetical protein [Thorsellia anophelis]